MQKTTATLGLLLVSLLWGLTFPIIRDSIQGLDPFHFVAWRFSLATILLFFVAKPHKQSLPNSLIKVACWIGLFNAVGYSLQTLGLQWIASSRSAFLSETSVIFIPLLMPFFKLGKPTLIDGIATVICLIGVYVITAPDIHNLYWADGLTLFAALCFAAVVNSIQVGSKKSTSPLLFTFLQISFTVPFVYIPVMFQQTHYVITSSMLFGLLFCAFFATVLALYLQNRCQPHVSPAKAALIFCLDPVFATAFDSLLNHSLITLQTIMGGSLIIFSILFSHASILLKKQLFDQES